MDRRAFVISAGTLSIGSATLIGSGAFSSVDANRDFDVDIAGDSEAYLRLDPDAPNYDNSGYAVDVDGSIGINITDEGDRFDGEGVSPFANTLIEEIFPIENQGTQEVQVSIRTSELKEDSSLQLFATPDPSSDKEFDRTNLLKSSGNLPVLAPGEAVAVGVEIDATGSSDDLESLKKLMSDLNVLIQATTDGVSS